MAQVGTWTLAVLALSLGHTPRSVADDALPRLQLGVTGGRIAGLAPSDRIDGVDVRASLEQRFAPALGGGPELAFLALAGVRDGRSSSGRGAALTYVLRWHALRRGSSSLYAAFGWGAALFDDPFPTGGTRLNGTSMFGLGAQLSLGRGAVVRVDAREVHVSNGRGLVPENPAFDGAQLAIGLAVVR